MSDICKVFLFVGDVGIINVDMGIIVVDDIGMLIVLKNFVNGVGLVNIDVVCKIGVKVSMKFVGKMVELSVDKKMLCVNNGNIVVGFV